MDTEKLTKWSKEIYENAVVHGWHEEKHSPEHYLGLIMTEVAEAVEADRNNWYCGEVETEMSDYVHNFDAWYRVWVKSSVEEEFADIVIRLLDMANSIHRDNFAYINHDGLFRNNKTFIEHAYYFVKEVLNCGIINISESILYIYEWAELLRIDLDQHIEWKMKYNSLRPYKHGGKKY